MMMMQTMIAAMIATTINSLTMKQKKEFLRKKQLEFDNALAEEEEKIKAPVRAQYERQGNPFYASARLWDDGVIDPLDTRRVLTLCLSLAARQPTQPTRFGVFRM